MPEIFEIARCAEIVKGMAALGNGLFAKEKIEIVREIAHCSLINFQENGAAFCFVNGRFEKHRAAYDALIRENAIEEGIRSGIAIVVVTDRLIDAIVEQDRKD